jgi:acyl-coenzyme A thioesterase PaaI-like protein
MTLPPENEILRFVPDGGCFGCSPDNPAGLQLPFVRRGDAIVVEYAVPERFHGAPEIAHGGIVAAIFDEVSCAAVCFLRERRVVTGELSVRYLRPCPIETPLVFSARVTDESHAKYAVVEAEVDREGEILARSTGRFFYSPRRVTAP